MDVSPEYVEMCEKAEEIQKGWKPTEWDYVFGERDKERQTLVLSGYCTDGGFYGAELEEEHRGIRDIVGVNFPIWLPRQDQLQEMIHDYKFSKRQFSGSHGLLRDFAYWVEEESKLPCASMEQLWLAFVMLTLYHKKWYNGEWQ